MSLIINTLFLLSTITTTYDKKLYLRRITLCQSEGWNDKANNWKFIKAMWTTRKLPELPSTGTFSFRKKVTEEPAHSGTAHENEEVTAEVDKKDEVKEGYSLQDTSD